MAALSLAETAMARGDTAEARNQADRAMKQLPEGSPAWLRAQDIFNTADREEQNNSLGPWRTNEQIPRDRQAGGPAVILPRRTAPRFPAPPFP